MKTEQIIKKQARGAMRGNLSTLIAAAGLASLVLLLLEYLEYLALYLEGAVNLDTGSVKDGYLFVYSVDEAEHVIHVIRYFHGLQNYQGLL